MNIRHIIGVLGRRKWYLIASVLVIGGLGAGSAYLLTPVYTATATILIRQSGPELGFIRELELGPSSLLLPTSSASSQTYVQLIQASPVLEEVINKLQIRGKGGHLIPPSKLMKVGLLSAFKPRPVVKLTPARNTPLIQVTALSPDPLEAKYLADTLCETFEDARHRQITASLRSVIADLKDRVEKARSDFERSLIELASYKEKAHTVDIGSEIQLTIQTITRLLAEKVETNSEILQTEATIQTLRKELLKTEVPTAEMIKADPLLEDLLKRLSTTKQRRTALLNAYAKDHPEVKKVDQQIVQIEQEIEKRKKSFLDNSPELVLKKRELSALKAKARTVEQALNEAIERLTSFPRREAEQTKYAMAVETNRGIFNSLLTYFHKIQILEKMSISDVEIIHRAELPSMPSFPRKKANIALGLFLGFLVGISIAFLVDHLDDTLKTPEELKEIEGVIYLGAIPKFRTRRHPLISSLSPTDRVSEAYRAVRNGLRFATLDRPFKRILVTSALDGEGKTLTAANLALSLAKEGSRVAVVSADLRRPSLHRLLGLPQEPGLTNILLGEAEMKTTLKETKMENLWLLSSGPVPPDPAGVIESKRILELFDSLSEEFEWVVIDSPPLMLVNDPYVLAGICDVVLLVVESHRVPRPVATSSIEQIRKTRDRNVLAILNKLRLRGSRYYSYYYSYYSR